jgi:hypothetical protein
LLLSHNTRNISTTPIWSVRPMTVHRHVLMAEPMHCDFLKTVF